jgi:hypothetical protein
MRFVASILFLMISPACYADGCLLGILNIAHEDCSTAASTFPRDDASCRCSYGLTPGTHDYVVCRKAKAAMNARTLDETSYSFLRNPLLPDVR